MVVVMSAAASAPAVAATVPAVERTSGGVIAASAFVGSQSVAADFVVGGPVLVGLAGTLFDTDIPRDHFVAARITHRLWTGPGGSALGYLISAGWKTTYIGDWGYDSQAELMPALVGTLVLARSAGMTAKLRVTYGPVFVPYKYGAFRHSALGLPFDTGPDDTGSHRLLPPISWGLNPEIGVDLANGFEWFCSLRGEFGARYRW